LGHQDLLGLLQKVLDYAVDSDEEWEEEDPGESLSDSEVGRQGRDVTCEGGSGNELGREGGAGGIRHFMQLWNKWVWHRRV